MSGRKESNRIPPPIDARLHGLEGTGQEVILYLNASSDAMNVHLVQEGKEKKIFCLSYRSTGTNDDERGRSFILSLVLGCAALLCKETGLMSLLINLGFVGCRLLRRTRGQWRTKDDDAQRRCLSYAAAVSEGNTQHSRSS